MNLIPRLIHEHFVRQDYGGRFPAVALFADVSGFTSLTEALMHHGRDGAEVLSEVLSGVFGPLVAEVYARGGFISGFAGDAFTAVFPFDLPDAARQALRTAFFIQRFFAAHGQAQTRYGSFALGVRVGLGQGQVEWGILGAAGRHAYFFRGPALSACARAQVRAGRGEIVAHERVWPLVAGDVEAVPVGRHFRLLALRDAAEIPRRPAPPALPREALGPFIPDEVIDFALGQARGEFRQVASVFISFRAAGRRELGSFVSHLLDLAGRYGGYFKDIDFADKGGVIVVVFGAPVAHENDLQRAADLVLDLPPPLAGRLRWRVGLTYGTVYAGMMGGAERCEYTVIGDVVNLAARLAQRAEWGTAWLDAQAAAGLARRFRVESVGKFHFKGKRGALPVHRLAGRHETVEEVFFTGTMVGREKELADLAAFVRPIFEGRFAGLAYVYGEAGMGKSRLLYELRRALPSLGLPSAPAEGAAWFVCPADEVLRQSLNPFRHFLRRYFDQSPDHSEEENKRRFGRVMETLLADLARPPLASRPGCRALAQELDRTRSFLGALVDLRWEGSLYEQLEPRLRFENTLAAIKALFKAESLRRPLLIQLEDLNWLDADSVELLRALARELALGPAEGTAGYPVAILCTSRFRDDGSRVTLDLEATVPQMVVELDRLPLPGIQALARQVLAETAPPGYDLSPELAAFLADKTGGNPFFVEQLLLEWRERGALRAAGGLWNIVPDRMRELPTRIGAVLVARLDRLAARVRQVVQTAAVLGREFEVQVLSHVLQSAGHPLSDEVQRAEAERIWSPLREMYYIFRHSLLRDAAYEMQLQARRRELHRLAAAAIEQLYADELSPRYADLAHHYGRAGDIAGERHYARLAGERAASQFANIEALAYLGRALELTPPADRAARYAILLAREQVYHLQGARQDQRRDLEELQALAEALDDERRRIEVGLRWARAAEATGDYPRAIAAAQAVIERAQAAGDRADEAAGYLQWGRALWRQGEYEQARDCLERALAHARAAQARRLEADSLHNLGTTYFYLGDYPQARSHYGQGLQIYREIGDRQGESSALNNLANIAANQGDYAEARSYYERALRLKREIGDRRGEGNTLNNLGNTLADQAIYGQAIVWYRQSLQICREIGDRWGESAALGNLGNAFKHLGDYDDAWAYCEQALKVSREINYHQIECIAVDNLGVISMQQGRYAEAESYLQEALQLCRQRADRRDETVTLINLGLLAHLTGKDKVALEYAGEGLRVAQSLGDRTRQGTALTVRGHALAGLGSLAEASASYFQALELRRALGEQHLAMEALAGLARVALAQGDLSAALHRVDEILRYLETHLLDGCDEPFRVYLTCYQVLAAAQDSRAAGLLSTAYDLLELRAGRIADPDLRRSFLENVAAHREIVRLVQETRPRSP